jgi:hypothetical protein
LVRRWAGQHRNLGVDPTTAANFSKNWSPSFLAAASLVSMELEVSRSFPAKTR